MSMSAKKRKLLIYFPSIFYGSLDNNQDDG